MVQTKAISSHPNPNRDILPLVLLVHSKAKVIAANVSTLDAVAFLMLLIRITNVHNKIFDMQTNKELIIETLKEQGWKKFYLGSPFENGLEEDYSDVAEKILFMLQQFGTEIKPPLQQAAVMRGQSPELVF